MERKKRKNWRRFCGCCDVFYMPEKQLSVVSMSPSPAELSCCPIVILVGGHICPCPAPPCPACLRLSLAASFFAQLLCLVPCLFVCRACQLLLVYFYSFSFFLLLLHSVLCPVSCVLSRVLCPNLIAVGTAHMSQTQPDSDTDLESQSQSIEDATDWIFNQNVLPGGSYTLAPASTPTCAPFVLGFFNFS